jgi:hypothetical protein
MKVDKHNNKEEEYIITLSKDDAAHLLDDIFNVKSQMDSHEYEKLHYLEEFYDRISDVMEDIEG